MGQNLTTPMVIAFLSESSSWGILRALLIARMESGLQWVKGLKITVKKGKERKEKRVAERKKERKEVKHI